MTTFARGRRRRPGLPAGWERVTESTLAPWAGLDDEERARLAELMDLLVRHKRWEAAAGFELTDGMRVLIAGHAAVLILGLDFDWYRDVQAIVVHPSAITSREVRPGPVRGVVSDGPMLISGQASDRRGPVLIAWDAALGDARYPHRGQNVVFHEFAHKLDLLDDVLDGTPPLPDQAARDRWRAVCTAEYEALRAGAGDELLRDYGAVSPAEFFAVATEVFFDRPVDLRAGKPTLYAVLRDFYRQDPAAR